VTITGTNFTGATAVTFGSHAATSFTVVNSTEITAMAPEDTAGTVDITVTTPSGTSLAGAGAQFTYGSVPVNTVEPVVSGVATVGSTLTCVPGEWTGAPTPTLTHSWNGAGSPTNGLTYVPVTGDIGQDLYCTETATNSYGSPSVQSNTVGPILVGEVTPVGSPTILANQGNGSTTVFTLAARTGITGNALKLRVTAGSAAGAPTFTISGGGTWDTIAQNAMANYYGDGVFILPSPPSNVTVVITCSHAPDSQALQARLTEYDNLGAIDFTTAVTTGDSETPTFQMPLLAGIGELVEINAINQNGETGFTGNDWTTTTTPTIFGENAAPTAYQIATSIETAAVEWTMDARQWWAYGIAFKPLGAPSGGGGSGVILPAPAALNSLGYTWEMLGHDEFEGTAGQTANEFLTTELALPQLAWGLGDFGSATPGSLSPTVQQSAPAGDDITYYAPSSVISAGSGNGILLRRQPATGGPYTSDTSSIESTPSGAWDGYEQQTGGITSAGLWLINPRAMATHYGASLQPVAGAPEPELVVEFRWRASERNTSDYPIVCGYNEGDSGPGGFSTPSGSASGGSWTSEIDWAENGDEYLNFHFPGYGPGVMNGNGPLASSPGSLNTLTYHIRTASSSDSSIAVYCNDTLVSDPTNITAAQLWYIFGFPQYIFFTNWGSGGALDHGPSDAQLVYVRIWSAVAS
jgi:hypothetical protein